VKKRQVKFRVTKIAFASTLWLALAACNQRFGGIGQDLNPPANPQAGAIVSIGGISGPNVLTAQVGATSVCSGAPNLLCASLQICSPGTSNCQTISDILVDTGSYGLRVFSSALSVPLTQQLDSGGKSVAECASFGSGDTWGPIKNANVIMGGEPAVQLEIQVIDTHFASVPKSCTNLMTDPVSAGFNGILGIGLFATDCGAGCADPTKGPTAGIYFSCSGTTCAGIARAEADQVSNPVSFLPTDNNGVVIVLPTLPGGVAAQVNGALILGIGTQSNNAPAGVSKFQADANGNFDTTFSGKKYGPGGTGLSFIDSGSNGLFFPPISGLTACSTSGSTNGFYCPSSTMNLSATMAGMSGSASATLSFSISNADSLINSPNQAFTSLGGDDASDFDWGLPFFYGRKVFVGIDAKSSPVGTGPYWAF